MADYVQASEAVSALKEYSESNKIPILKIEALSDDEFKKTQLYSASSNGSFKDFLEFCKKLETSFFTYAEFVLEKSDLEEILEDGQKDQESEDDEEDEELGLSPKATSIIEDSIKRQVDNLMSNVNQLGCVVVFGHKQENVFKFMVTNDWYELYVKLSDVYDNLEENGPEILSSDEIVKFNKEMGIRESRESIMKRRAAELEVKKDEFFNLLSKDKIFLNAKNISLRMARVEKLMPENLEEFITKREAVDGGVNAFMQTIEKMSSGGMSKTDIAKDLGIREAVLKKYLDLG